MVLGNFPETNGPGIPRGEPMKNKFKNPFVWVLRFDTVCYIGGGGSKIIDFCATYIIKVCPLSVFLLHT